MGEIADLMINGDICEGCCCTLRGAGEGFPRRCASCAREHRAAEHAQTLAHQQQVKKVPCCICGRKVKAIGMANHIKDAHSFGAAPVAGTGREG